MNDLPTGATPDKPLRRDECLTLPFIPDDQWHTEDQLRAAMTEHGVAVDNLAGLLRRLRRRGWVVLNRRSEPPSWTRTPMGKAAADKILTAAA